MSQVLFIESNLTGSGYDAISFAASAGHEVLLASREPELYREGGHAALDFRCVEQIVRCETNSANSVLRAIEEHDLHPDAVLAVGEWHTIVAADVAQVLGLRGASPQAVRTARNKLLTRRRCAAAGVLVPQFTVVDSADAAIAAWPGVPRVLKPVDDAGGKGVRLCTSADEAEEHVRAVLADRWNERGQVHVPLLLLEEYVIGPEYSAEILIDENGPHPVALTGKELGPLPDFEEIGHVVPALVSEQERAGLLSFACRAAVAIGLDFGAAHIEMRVGSRGPCLIEVNCRPAGGFITRLVRAVTGIDIPAHLVGMHLGQHVERGPVLSPAAAIRFLRSSATDAGYDSRRASILTDADEVEMYPGSEGRPGRSGHVISLGKEASLARERARSICTSLSRTHQG